MVTIARSVAGDVRELESAIADARRAAATAVNELRHELSGRRSELQSAEAALRACQKDRDADCGHLSQAYRRAASRVSSAEAAVRLGERALGSFEPRAARAERAGAALVTAVQRRISTLVTDVDTYASAASLSLGGTIADVVGAPAGAGASAAVSSSSIPGSPAGFAMIPIAQCDISENPITGPSDFGKGYTPEDLSWAFEALHDVVLPAMSRGYGIEYFEERDAATGRIGSRSYSDTFRGFFQSDAIRLEPRPDGRYGITNGRHRIWVAQQLGLAEIPARIR